MSNIDIDIQLMNVYETLYFNFDAIFKCWIDDLNLDRIDSMDKYIIHNIILINDDVKICTTTEHYFRVIKLDILTFTSNWLNKYHSKSQPQKPVIGFIEFIQVLIFTLSVFIGVRLIFKIGRRLLYRMFGWKRLISFSKMSNQLKYSEIHYGAQKLEISTLQVAFIIFFKFYFIS